MSLQFNGYGRDPGEAIRERWGNDINGIFEAYQQAKQNSRLDQASALQAQLGQQQLAQGQRQQAMGNIQDTAQFGAPLSSYSNGDIQTANQQASPNFNGPVNPRIAHLAQGLHEIQQQKEAQIQGASVGLEKTRAESAKLKSEADINNMFSGAASGGAMAGGLSDWANTLRADVEAGRKAPSQAQAEASRLGPQGMGRLIVDKALAGLDQAGLEAAYHKKTATAGFEGGEGAQKPARLMKSLIPSLDYLGSISKDMNNDSWKTINKYGIKIAAERGDSKAQEMLDASSAISDEFQAMIGGGSNAKLELGMHLFESSKTPEQLARSINFVKQNLNNRSEALLGKEKGTPIKTLEQTRASQSSGDVQVKTLKDGTQVKVRPNGKGGYDEVP